MLKLAWRLGAAQGASSRIRVYSDGLEAETAKIDVQGPQAPRIAQRLFGVSVFGVSSI